MNVITNSLQEVEVRLVGSNNQETSGRVKIQSWDSKARLKRALKTLGISWVCGICSLPLPPVHWVLVPGFILGGPFVAMYIYGQAQMILSGEGACPNCGQPFTVAKGEPQFPLSDVCDKCHSQVTVLLKTEISPKV